MQGKFMNKINFRYFVFFLILLFSSIDRLYSSSLSICGVGGTSQHLRELIAISEAFDSHRSEFKDEMDVFNEHKKEAVRRFFEGIKVPRELIYIT